MLFGITQIYEISVKNSKKSAAESAALSIGEISYSLKWISRKRRGPPLVEM